MTVVSAVRMCAGMFVVTFARVLEERVAVGHEACEEALEIAAHLRVGVFLEEQRRGGVLEMQRGEAGLQAALADQFPDLRGEFVEAASARGDDQFVQVLAEHGGASLFTVEWDFGWVSSKLKVQSPRQGPKPKAPIQRKQRGK